MNEIKKAIDIYEKLSDEEKEIALKAIEDKLLGKEKEYICTICGKEYIKELLYSHHGCFD